eukprot:3100563-Amphidinium_carterae.1
MNHHGISQPAKYHQRQNMTQERWRARNAASNSQSSSHSLHTKFGIETNQKQRPKVRKEWQKRSAQNSICWALRQSGRLEERIRLNPGELLWQGKSWTLTLSTSSSCDWRPCVRES